MMKLEIDTRYDSPDEIRKAIKILEHLVGSSISSINSPADSPAADSPADEHPPIEGNVANTFVSMFGLSGEQGGLKEEPVKKLLMEEEDIEDIEEKKEKEIPRVVPY